MPQDEELFLADEPYVDIILQVLDTVKTLDSKRNLLLEALLQKRVIKELNKRKTLLTLAGGSISDYIKEIVYPLLTANKNMKKIDKN